MKKTLFSALMTVGVVAVGVSAPVAASAATTTTVCAEGCDYTTIQAAVDAAAAGDTIEVVEDLTVAGTTNVNKDVTVTGVPGVTVTQTASAITFRLSADGSTLSNLTITSDTPKAREFVQIGGDDVTLSGNTIYGPEQALPMSGWVGNRGFVTQHAITGFVAEGNTFHSMRSGAYLNPNGTGEISGNTVYNTKGDFLIDNANFSFDGNRAGDPSQPSEWGFVVFATTAPDRYPSVLELSRDNNWMTAWDQRTGDTHVPVPANPAAQVVTGCGYADVTLTNTSLPGTDPADAVFTVILDGVAETVTVEADGTETIAMTFTEDSGDHEVGIYAGENLLESATVSSDCLLSNKEECKNGRWATSTSPVFKNQGQCVSSFAKAAGKNNKH